MTNDYQFPTLEGWDETKETLHAYTKILGAVTRAHGIFHPKWWHISLKVSPTGLVTDDIGLPSGGILRLRMDFFNHNLVVEASDGSFHSFPMNGGDTARQLAEKVLTALDQYGLPDLYKESLYSNDDPRGYDPPAAGKFFAALVNINQVFKEHRAAIGGEVGPVQFWPHGFDLAFEWFGTGTVKYEEDGEITVHSAQLNLGWSLGETSHPAPYFYSNPWPFENQILIAQPLPGTARWFTEGWMGSILPYADLVGEPGGSEGLRVYAKAVFEIASPTLLADPT